jgi:hypothetical protein
MMNGVKVRKISAKDIPRIVEIQESTTKKKVPRLQSSEHRDLAEGAGCCGVCRLTRRRSGRFHHRIDQGPPVWNREKWVDSRATCLPS